MDRASTLAAGKEIDGLFREIVLCLGGIFAVQEVSDELVWQVVRNLYRIYRRVRATNRHTCDGDGLPMGWPGTVQHPAVMHLLEQMGAAK